MVQYLLDEYRTPIRRACGLVFLSHSVWYYKPQPRDDKHLRMRIREIAETRLRYGFWRIYALLKREGFMDNHKRVYRIYKEEGLNLRSKRPRRNKAASHRMERPNTRTINECWSMDFVSDQLFNGNRFRALTILDNFSRKCMDIHVGKSLKGEDVVMVLNKLYHYQKQLPKRIQVDNGSEFISKVLDKWAYENNVILDFSRPGKPTDNPFIESFNGSFRDECLNTNWFLSLSDAKQKIDLWKDEYNNFRPHSSINFQAPNQVFEKQEEVPVL